jgi:hypothetical protein
MQHENLRRAAARRSLNLDSTHHVHYGHGLFVESRFANLRAQRSGMTDTAYVIGRMVIASNRRLSRMDVADEMRSMKRPPLNAKRLRARRTHFKILAPEIPAHRRHRIERKALWNGVKPRQRFGPQSRVERVNRRYRAFDATNRKSSMYGRDSEPMYVR